MRGSSCAQTRHSSSAAILVVLVVAIMVAIAIVVMSSIDGPRTEEAPVARNGDE